MKKTSGFYLASLAKQLNLKQIRGAKKGHKIVTKALTATASIGYRMVLAQHVVFGLRSAGWEVQQNNNKYL